MKQAICLLFIFTLTSFLRTEVSYEEQSGALNSILPEGIYVFEVVLNSKEAYCVTEIIPPVPSNLSFLKISLEETGNRKKLKAYFKAISIGKAATGDFRINILQNGENTELHIPGRLIEVKSFFLFYKNKIIISLCGLIILCLVFFILFFRKMQRKKRKLKEQAILKLQNKKHLREQLLEKMVECERLKIKGEYQGTVNLAVTLLNNYFKELTGNNSFDLSSLNKESVISGEQKAKLSAFLKERDRLLFAGNNIFVNDVDKFLKQLKTIVLE